MIGRTLIAASALLGLAASQCDDYPCNGDYDFCDRKYSNVSLIGAHDSAFVGPQGDPRVNQEVNITAQLDAGIRYFEAQTHVLNDTISLCHTSCVLLYSGTLHDYLAPVTTWLDANPHEVVTMLLTNGEGRDPTEFASIYSAVGLDKYAFVPSTSPKTLPYDSWPTYGELIEAGTRIITFLDAGANETKVPYLLDEFSYYFETPYDTTDPSFNECKLDRPANSSPDGKMYIMNHFLDKELIPGNSGILIPDNELDNQTNAATGNGSIGAQADLCFSLYGRVPNVVFVDFFDIGDVFTAQKNLNAE